MNQVKEREQTHQQRQYDGPVRGFVYLALPSLALWALVVGIVALGFVVFGS